MNYKKILIVIGISLIGLSSFGQSITRHSMQHLPSAGITNPSFYPDFRYSIGILPFPSFNFNFETNIKLKNAYSLDRSAQDTVLLLHPTKFINSMGKVNYVRTGFDYEILSTSFKIKKNYFSLALTTHMETEIRLPRDLFALAWQGNGNYIGKRISFDGLGMDATVYNELAIGYSREITEKLHAGLRLSLLQGLANMQTKTEIGLTTDTLTYWLHADFDGEVNMSGPMDTSLFFGSEDGDPLSDFMGNSSNFGLSNFGLGFDIGVDYDLTDNFNIALSVNDLGYIKWNNAVKTYSVKDGAISFEGFMIDSSLNFDFDSAYFSNLQDTIFDMFEPEKSLNSYSTRLTPKVYLGLSYELNEKNRFGFIAYNHLHRDYTMASFSLLYNRKLWSFIDLAGNYTFNTYGQSKFGLGLSLRILGSNFYIMTNDIGSMIMPQNANTINFNFGWYYVKRKPKKEKKSTKKKKSDFEF
jgi:hypothetical protein